MNSYSADTFKNFAKLETVYTQNWCDNREEDEFAKRADNSQHVFKRRSINKELTSLKNQHTTVS